MSNIDNDKDHSSNQLRPDYYGGKTNPYEVVKVTRAWGLNFELGNAIKYIARAGKKTSSSIEDIKKAITYLEMELAEQLAKEDKSVVEEIVIPKPQVAYPNGPLGIVPPIGTCLHYTRVKGRCSNCGDCDHSNIGRLNGRESYVCITCGLAI